MSYYLWVEAVKGKLSGNFSGFVKAWEIMETYFIPSDDI